MINDMFNIQSLYGCFYGWMKCISCICPFKQWRSYIFWRLGRVITMVVRNRNYEL